MDPLKAYGLETSLEAAGKDEIILNFDEPFDTSRVVRPRTSDPHPRKTSNGINMYGAISQRSLITILAIPGS